jgi:hypothetical protein
MDSAKNVTTMDFGCGPKYENYPLHWMVVIFWSNCSFFSPFNPQRNVVHMLHISKLQALCSFWMLQIIIW